MVTFVREKKLTDILSKGPRDARSARAVRRGVGDGGGKRLRSVPVGRLVEGEAPRGDRPSFAVPAFGGKRTY